MTPNSFTDGDEEFTYGFVAGFIAGAVITTFWLKVVCRVK